MDCSSSGPQILSLLRLKGEFQTYLNLTDSEIKYDFYIEIIFNFIQKDKSINKHTFKENAYIILRKICKTDIMTQAYNISYQKFAKELEMGFMKYKEDLNIKEYEKFVEKFLVLFTKFRLIHIKGFV